MVSTAASCTHGAIGCPVVEVQGACSSSGNAPECLLQVQGVVLTLIAAGMILVVAAAW
jgi:hypothetical protein